MWRILSEDERQRLLKVLGTRNKLFCIMLFLYGLLTIFLMLVCYKGLLIIIPIILICLLFSINIVIGLMIAICIALPFNLLGEVAGISIIGMYFLAFLFNAQNYGTKIKLISNDYVKTCKTRIVRITKKSKYTNTVTVRVMINDIFKEMDIDSGKNFKEDEDVYILAYGDNSNQMELFKESEFTEFL